MNATIVYGPQGCGKTQHAKVLCARFGCESIVDDWAPGQPLTDGALHLTQEDVSADMRLPNGVLGSLRVVAFKDVGPVAQSV